MNTLDNTAIRDAGEVAVQYEINPVLVTSLSVQDQLEVIAQSPEGIEAIIQMTCDLVDRRFAAVKRVCFKSPEIVKNVIKARLGHLEHEEFAVLFLDNKHREIAFKTMFRGTIDGAAVYPREVVKEALKHNAAACLLAHNHPSGSLEPSSADISLTRCLKDALALVDVRVLDHIIIGEGSPCSMAEQNLM